MEQETVDSGQFRAGVIINPAGGNNRKALPMLEKVLSQFPEVPYLYAKTPDEMQKALFQLAARKVNLLVTSGGDGTVQAVVTCLMNQHPFPHPPVLALAQGGTANLTAKNIGLSGRPEKALHRLLRSIYPKHSPNIRLSKHHVLRITTPALPHAMYGFLFGAGLICKGIRFFHSRAQVLSKNRLLAHILIVSRFLMALARRDREVASPVAVKAKLMDREGDIRELSDDFLLFMAGTLDRLILGLRPRWSNPSQEAWFMAVKAHPNSLVKNLAGRILPYSSCSPREEDGYIGMGFEKMELELQDDFTIDGELFAGNADEGGVVVENGGTLSFIQV